MDARDIAAQRLVALGLVGGSSGPADVVSDLVAVQAQDYGMAKWSVGQRSNATARDVEELVNSGALVRTHVMRPTWHFVHRADLRWLLALTGPRVQVNLASASLRFGLDHVVRDHSAEVFAAALRGGAHLTRKELADMAADAGIVTDGIGFGHLLMHAELEAVICSGPRRGAHATYALVDERVGPSPARPREDAAAELAVRYFTGHGPATANDFRWWSSLTVTEVRKAIAAAGDQLTRFQAGARTYWASREAPAPREVPASREAQAPREEPAPRGEPVVHLLQVFDELIVGYRESRDTFDVVGTAHLTGTDWGRDGHPVVVAGQVVGRWRRKITTKTVVVEVKVPTMLWAAQKDGFEEAAAAFGEHLGVEASLSFVAAP